MTLRCIFMNIPALKKQSSQCAENPHINPHLKEFKPKTSFRERRKYTLMRQNSSCLSTMFVTILTFIFMTYVELVEVSEKRDKEL